VRFVHTSDWHLGKRLCEANLLDDQAHALDQIFRICKAEGAEALIIAGDLYDRAVPPVEAVTLLSDFFHRVASDLAIPVIAISGNHDSPDRLGFGSAILEKGRVHLRTSFERRAEPVVIEHRRRKTHVYCLPYTEPQDVREKLGDLGITTHDQAVREALVAVRADRDARRAEEAILVGHMLAAGGRESTESERPLVIGGAAQVGTPVLSGWSYVALGHLHRPQSVGGREDVRYSGSPLKYSFGEADHQKLVNLVELVCGRATLRGIPIVPRRDLVRIEGAFDELLSAERFSAAEEAFVEATYTDAGYVIDAAARLRQRFPHLLLALPKQVLRQLDDPSRVLASGSPDSRALLESFWKYVEGEDPLDAAAIAAFDRALQAVHRRQAEPCALAS
jgi:exonuclease SbcD